jgi:hypothetical protein
MPTTDWNWFFSSVAQSAAAIVGIFGAFIVTKILANQTAFAEKSLRMQELITLGHKLTDASGRLSFDWYHRNDSADELEKLERLLEKDDSQTPEALHEKLRFSPYIARADVIATIARAKSLREKRLQREREKTGRHLEQNRSPGFSAIARTTDSDLLRGINLPRLHLGPQLEKEREEIDSLYTEAKHHARVVSDFYAIVSPNPESSPIITTSLILILALFFTGVIYPLSFMPLPTDWKPALSLAQVPAFIFSLRGALLGCVSLLFTAMLAMFFVMNIRLKYPAAMLERLEKFKHLSEYSQYFANREVNAAHRTAVES